MALEYVADCIPDLGRFGYAVNIISVCWSALVIAMYISPLYVPVTIATIDYMVSPTGALHAISTLLTRTHKELELRHCRSDHTLSWNLVDMEGEEDLHQGE